MFINLKYPVSLVNSTTSHFVALMMSGDPNVPAQLPANENTVHQAVFNNYSLKAK